MSANEATEDSGSKLLQTNEQNGEAESVEVSSKKRERQKLSLAQTVSFMFSSVGGTSIFIATSTVLRNTGSVGLSLIVVLISGLLNYSLAMCFTEVATLLPRSGGPYFFMLSVFGPFPAFMFFWGFLFFVVIPVWSVTAFGASVYIVQLFFPGCQPPMLAVKLLAVVLLALVVVVNCLYIQYVNKVQNILSVTKVVAVVIILACAVYGLATGEAAKTGSFDNVFEGTTDQPGQIALSFLTGMFLFGGWQIITFLIEEMDSPQKNLPRALQISIGLVTAIFEVVLLCYFVLITPGEMKNIDAVATVFLERVSRPLGPVMTVLITLSSVGSLNAVVFGQSNFIVAVAKNKHLPRIFASVSDTYRMPWMASIVLFGFSVILTMFGNLMMMIEMVSFYAVIMSLCVLACLLALRLTEPDAYRPIKVWLATVIAQVLVNVALLVMSIVQKPEAFGRMVLFILAGVPVYLICFAWKHKPAAFTNFIEQASRFIQKILLLRLL